MNFIKLLKLKMLKSSFNNVVSRKVVIISGKVLFKLLLDWVSFVVIIVVVMMVIGLVGLEISVFVFLKMLVMIVRIMVVYKFVFGLSLDCMLKASVIGKVMMVVRNVLDKFFFKEGAGVCFLNRGLNGMEIGCYKILF